MSAAILTTVKQSLGMAEGYNAFDAEVILAVNSAFSTLHQIGVGPANGFEISGDQEVWGEFLKDEPTLNAVKTYVSLRSRLLVDPPTTSYALDAVSKQITELEWRLQVVADQLRITNPSKWK